MHPDFNSTIIGATTRSPIAFFLVPFMLVWSGGSLGGIYGTQILVGEFDMFKSLFGIPFSLGYLIFWSLAIMTIWAKVEVILDNKGGEIFTGIGSLGITNQFLWNEVSRTNEKQTTIRYPGSQGTGLFLEGKKRISFGAGLKEERCYYLLRGIKSIMSKKR
jgi:hypothetical protein